jgi:hypothetical protein
LTHSSTSFALSSHDAMVMGGVLLVVGLLMGLQVQPPSTAHCTLHTAHCTLHTAHCTLHTAHCTLHTAHCTLHTAHCTLHTAGSPGDAAIFASGRQQNRVIGQLAPAASLIVSKYCDPVDRRPYVSMALHTVVLHSVQCTPCHTTVQHTIV